MKLKSFYKGQLYIITQSPHGINQSFKAMDFGFLGYSDKQLYAPADLIFKRSWGVDYDGGCEYWVAGCEGVYIQFVHITPLLRSKVAQGSIFGVSKGDHAHVAINIKGSWELYLNYAERSAKLFWWENGQTNSKWAQWDTYPDKNLICYNEIMKDIFKLNTPLTLVSTNTVDLNIRKEPTTSAAIIGKLAPNTKFETRELVSGQEIGNQPLWFFYNGGWVSGEYMQDASVVNTQCEVELALAKKKLAALEIENAVLKEELSKFQPVTYYTKL